ncbi:MAG: ABC transporter permease [Spirochaetaceae bacterium]|nr:ABC transporter permease [Spirochaetaceae bacterium]
MKTLEDTKTAVDHHSKSYLHHLFAAALKYGVYTIFLIMIVVFAFSNPRFLTIGNLMLILQQASPLGISVVGMTLVLILAGIDISVGRNMFLSATIIAFFLNKTVFLNPETVGVVGGYIIILLISLISGALIGLVNGVLVAKLKIVPFIATLAIGSICRGFGLIVSEQKTPSTSYLNSFTNSRVMGIPVTLIIFIVIAIIFDYILRRTTFGRHLFAIGNSPETARKSGINVNRNIIFAYILCGALAGFAGIILAGQIGSVPVNFGNGNEFIVISAAILGGMSLFGGKGTIIPGAFIGIILVTTIMNGLAMINASPYVYTIVRGLIIFSAVTVDSINYTGELR